MIQPRWHDRESSNYATTEKKKDSHIQIGSAIVIGPAVMFCFSLCLSITTMNDIQINPKMPKVLESCTLISQLKQRIIE